MKTRKSILTKVFAFCLVAILVLQTVGCGSSSGKGTVTLNFIYGGDMAVIELYNALVEEFNNTAGKENKIKVKGVPKTGSIDSVLSQQLPSKSGPDLVSMTDKEFKRFSQYLEDMTGKIDQKALDDFYPSSISRYHYNVETTTSNNDDPLYAVPCYNDPTILYYNKTALENVGVICISVAEEDLEAFNAGSGKDANGKTKADYGISVDVPAKGFYRSGTPFVPAADETNGSSWSMPTDEVLIFNDQIAMNWDEIEDVASLCTQDKNSKASSKYGYYTEWWFNYGWSVGGDCIEDTTGKGDWTFSLASDVPNYIVAEGKTYTGGYTGTEYKAGETLDVKDIVDAKSGDAISYKTDGTSYFHYTVNGAEAGNKDFSAELADGTLLELPSTKDAFARFCYLSGEGGINVCPYPDAFTGSNAVYYFTSGSLAFLVEESSCVSSIEKMMKEEWGIAPLPIYKTYTEPTNPDCDTVAKQGKVAGHSMGYSVSINSKSEAKDAAYVFVNWIATKGQEYIAKSGQVSSRASDKEVFIENSKFKNTNAILNSAMYAQAGDWWYMPDINWITGWANALNGKVRYGLMTFDEYIYSYIEQTNERLSEYKK